MNSRPNIRLLAGLWLGLEATGGASGAQGVAVHAPDVEVIWASALEAIVVVCLESIALAWVGAPGQSDGGA